jgi:hypothetical protein
VIFAKMTARGLALAAGGGREAINILIVVVMLVVFALAKLAERAARKAAEKRAEEAELLGRSEEEQLQADQPAAMPPQEARGPARADAPTRRYPPMPGYAHRQPAAPQHGPRPVPASRIPPPARRAGPAEEDIGEPIPVPLSMIQPVPVSPPPVQARPAAAPHVSRYPAQPAAAQAHRQAQPATGVPRATLDDVQQEIRRLQSHLANLEAMRSLRLGAIQPHMHEIHTYEPMIALEYSPRGAEHAALRGGVLVQLGSPEAGMAAMIYHEVFSPPVSLREDKPLWEI